MIEIQGWLEERMLGGRDALKKWMIIRFTPSTKPPPSQMNDLPKTVITVKSSLSLNGYARHDLCLHFCLILILILESLELHQLLICVVLSTQCLIGESCSCRGSKFGHSVAWSFKKLLEYQSGHSFKKKSDNCWWSTVAGPLVAPQPGTRRTPPTHSNVPLLQAPWSPPGLGQEGHFLLSLQ